MQPYPPLIIEISPDLNGMSIMTLLRSRMGFSRTRLRQLKKGEFVFRNGRPSALWECVVTGDTITIALPSLTQAIAGEDLPIKIVYEDADLAVIDKSPGMVVHPVRGHYGGTLANALVHHWAVRGETASFHPVHRLDRWTSGLVVIAKSPWAHQQLDRSLQSGVLERTYLALASGSLASFSGRINAPIGLTEDLHHRGVLPDGQASATRFRVIRHLTDATLVMCRLETGRTHQIRVHLAHIDHPLVGDDFYGAEPGIFSRPALHAWRIRFKHPRMGKIIRLTSPVPEDMGEWIKR